VAEFGWGIVGAGAVARKFVLGLRASAGGRAVAVCSRTEASARGLASTLGVPKVHATLDALLADPAVQAVYIASPPAAHAQQALAAIVAKKPVLVEKPFATTAADAERVAEAARQAGVFCMEAMWTRFLPALRAARELIASGALGELRLATGSFGLAEQVDRQNHHFLPEQGGGALLDRGVYPLSLAHHLLGAPRAIQAAAWRGETGVDEEITATLTHASGAITTLQASLRTDLPNELLIAGTQATLRIEGPIFRPFRLHLAPTSPRAYGKGGPSKAEGFKESGGFHQALQRLSGLRHRVQGRHVRSSLHAYAGNGYHHQADDLMEAVRAGRRESAVMPLADSVAVLRSIEAIRRAAGLAD
jgi:predicted dehydrogenase